MTQTLAEKKKKKKKTYQIRIHQALVLSLIVAV